ncbi:MAG TPA: hypothetical protein VKS24_06755 [Bradyrhizobium sp.]|nr:hypothetical protein [Bradyrhizobium sp.]
MKNFTLIGVAALSLSFAAPAMAASNGHRSAGVYHRHYGPVMHRMTAMDFDHYDLGIARPTYPSGWSGPYGDGLYPGSIDANMGPPYWARR